MLKGLKLFLLLLIPTFLMGQETSSQTYTAFDGTKFSIGDTILIGVGSRRDNFLESLYILETNKDNKMPNTNVIIKKIITVSSKIIFKVKPLNQFFNFDLDINTALLNSEIILNKNEFRKRGWERTFSYKPLTDTTAFLYFIRTSKDTISKYAKEYLFLYDRTTYDNIRLDEFEFKKGLRNAQKTIQEKFNQIDTNTIHYVATSFTVADYDFDNQSFALLSNKVPWEGGAAIKSHRKEKEYSLNKEGQNVSQTNVSLLFQNFKEFSTFKISENEASSFLKRKKDTNGNVDRTVYVSIAFKLKSGSKIVSKENPKSNIFFINWYGDNSKYICYINAEIKEIYVYDNQNYLYNVLGSKLKR